MFLPRCVLCGRLRQWMGGWSHMTYRIIVCGTLPPVRRLMNRLYRWVLHGIAWDGMSLFLMMRAYKALLGSLIPLVLRRRMKSNNFYILRRMRAACPYTRNGSMHLDQFLRLDA